MTEELASAGVMRKTHQVHLGQGAVLRGDGCGIRKTKCVRRERVSRTLVSPMSDD